MITYSSELLNGLLLILMTIMYFIPVVRSTGGYRKDEVDLVIKAQSKQRKTEKGHTEMIVWQSNIPHLKNNTLRLVKIDSDDEFHVLYIKPKNTNSFLEASKPYVRYSVTLLADSVYLIIRAIKYADSGSFILEVQDKHQNWKGDATLLTITGCVLSATADKEICKPEKKTEPRNLDPESLKFQYTPTLILAISMSTFCIGIFIFGVAINEWGKYKGRRDRYQVLDICCPHSFTVSVTEPDDPKPVNEMYQRKTAGVFHQSIRSAAIASSRAKEAEKMTKNVKAPIDESKPILNSPQQSAFGPVQISRHK